MAANQQLFLLIDRLLRQIYSISFNDTGYGEDEWLARYGDLSPEEAVKSFGEKYDLNVRDEQ